MPAGVKPWGIGRKDYSVEVVRITIPTIKGEQSPYWKTTIDTLPTSIPQDWVPKGYRFALGKVEITADCDCLIELDIWTEIKVSPTHSYFYPTLLSKVGYQELIFDADYCYYWPIPVKGQYEGQRPVYNIWSGEFPSQTKVAVNIYGILEKVI